MSECALRVARLTSRWPGLPPVRVHRPDIGGDDERVRVDVGG